MGLLIEDIQSNIAKYGIAFIRNNKYDNIPLRVIFNNLIEAHKHGIQLNVDNNVKILLSAIQYGNENGLVLINYTDVYLGKKPIFISNDLVNKYGYENILSTITKAENNSPSLSYMDVYLLLELTNDDISILKYVPKPFLNVNKRSIMAQYPNIKKAIETKDANLIDAIGEKTYDRLMSNDITYNNKTSPTVELKNEVLKSVEGIKEPVALARALYIELNRRVHYDYTYHFGNKDATMQNAQKRIQFNGEINLEHEIICIEWAKLYHDILIEAGFSEEDVQIEGNFDKHQWVSIRLPNNDYIIADASNAYNDVADAGIDIERAKLGKPMLEFLIVGPELKSQSINKVFEEAKKQGIDIEKMVYENEYLKNIDRQIGYARNNAYLSQRLSLADKQFGALGHNIYDEISKMKAAGRIESIIEMELPYEMNGHEAIQYYDMIFSKYNLTKNVHYSWSLLWVNNNDIEPICVIEYTDINSDKKYFVYSQQRGKMYMTSEEYREFCYKLDVVKEWSSDY